ncbi:PLAC8 family-domain-containing protein [Boeremia exigua]|uniref:PLAC8 family-domain-containing protein n=1 Tax=Boeremia exigua TaxID=749465 RepID=UPI001E8DB743|nr:PLAC8 family-domain-containing protein [Boeremia exigua]KAH6621734.1 PLAC8 family-domain-containing protein [Boeremia exigua]
MSTVQKQDWHHRGTACVTPLSTCCLTWWCPCVVYGRTRHRMKANGNMNTYSCCNTSCAAFAGMGIVGLSWILPLLNRGEVRAEYGLNGNGCKDCLCACCCAPCDLLQQEKEVEHREAQRRPLLDQPGKVDAMNYAPQ